MALNIFASLMHHYSAAHFEFMRAPAGEWHGVAGGIPGANAHCGTFSIPLFEDGTEGPDNLTSEIEPAESSPGGHLSIVTLTPQHPH
jgi:hypothetical protein